ncbi:MAG: Dna2/Cas4 domain-containing protein, partial [Firmicutes bacterium]|nr:Dna2/Cas4 domain-containing protein [Bacillota bacterium]
MIITYSEDDLLLLSGIQHFAYCERQWALIHIEQQWLENVRTVEGRHLHERVHNPDLVEKRGDLLVARSLPIVSWRLGLYGMMDLVEFRQVGSDQGGIKLPNREGVWLPKPVEYKRGKPKTDDRDEVQLCAQAIC